LVFLGLAGVASPPWSGDGVPAGGASDAFVAAASVVVGGDASGDDALGDGDASGDDVLCRQWRKLVSDTAADFASPVASRTVSVA
jgi:hypothetical protein